MLATCRRHQNHGKFNGSLEEQFDLLDKAVEAGAQAVDFEIETAEAAAERLGRFAGERWSSSPITISRRRPPWT